MRPFGLRDETRIQIVETNLHNKIDEFLFERAVLGRLCSLGRLLLVFSQGRQVPPCSRGVEPRLLVPRAIPHNMRVLQGPLGRRWPDFDFVHEILGH